MSFHATAAQRARSKRSLRDRAGKIGRAGFAHVVLLILCFTTVMPFIWMVLASFKDFEELVRAKTFLPRVWTLDNYRWVVFSLGFPHALKNSTIVAVIVTSTTLLTSAATGYVFAKYHFWGKEQLFTLLLSTMMVPFAVVLVPLYVSIAKMGLVNQLPGIIVTGFWSTFGIFMMRQFMETVPSELLDAARIDGAPEWRIFFTIMIPLSTAPLAALAIFTFLGSWDSFLWPWVVLNSPDKQTLPLMLARAFIYVGVVAYNWTAAGAMLTVLPVMTIYAFVSKHFIRGIALTGMKA